MNFYHTPMGRTFFERHVPQLIQALQAVADGLRKPAQPVMLPVEPDREFLSRLYFGEYESSPFQPTPEGKERTRTVNAAYRELEESLPKDCIDKLVKYQDILTERETIDLRLAYESGFRTAVQMMVAGLSSPAAE